MTRTVVRVMPYIPSWYRMPTIQTREDWAHDQKIAKELGMPEPRPCTSCELCLVKIGLDCHQEEVWLRPVRIGKKLEIMVLCGMCADEAGLDFSYRIIDRETMRSFGTNRYRTPQLIQIKRKEITDALKPGPRHGA